MDEVGDGRSITIRRRGTRALGRLTRVEIPATSDFDLHRESRKCVRPRENDVSKCLALILQAYLPDEFPEVWFVTDVVVDRFTLEMYDFCDSCLSSFIQPSQGVLLVV
jgi:hypothetical protein